MSTVIAQFGAAARAALSAGFDLLELNFGQGYLVASFLSPLSNRRDDAYGGGLENRMRFPIEVLDAVREAWHGPLAVRIASDWASGGFDLDDAVALAVTLKAHGCDLVHAVMGQNVVEASPDYGRMFGVPAADRIRNEAGVPTIASGHITTFDEANTILAGGRADLCVLPLIDARR
jgi:anthraniloyl-CoA monooxygenase